MRHYRHGAHTKYEEAVLGPSFLSERVFGSKLGEHYGRYDKNYIDEQEGEQVAEDGRFQIDPS